MLMFSYILYEKRRLYLSRNIYDEEKEENLLHSEHRQLGLVFKYNFCVAESV